MGTGLTSEQMQQIVNNTVAVLLARPDLLPEWHANLYNLMRQAQSASLEDEALFAAAVLALLHVPEDELPTGTPYDYVWQAILTSLQTGVIQTIGEPDDTVTVKRLLQSVTEATVAVLTQMPEQKNEVRSQVVEMRLAALQAEVDELTRWLDDVLKLLEGQDVGTLGEGHRGMYAAYWNAVVKNMRD